MAERSPRRIAQGRLLGMIRRCTDPTNPRFTRYGGRGITVYPEWVASFDAFYAYVGDAPAGMTLDRIDNDRGYEPGNVRWATPKEQAANRTRQNQYDGRTHCSHGHEYTSENTKITKRGRGCRQCSRDKWAREKAARPPKVAPTECPHGHPYDEANTYVRARGSYVCRACRREGMRARVTA